MISMGISISFLMLTILKEHLSRDHGPKYVPLDGNILWEWLHDQETTSMKSKNDNIVFHQTIRPTYSDVALCHLWWTIHITTPSLQYLDENYMPTYVLWPEYRSMHSKHFSIVFRWCSVKLFVHTEIEISISYSKANTGASFFLIQLNQQIYDVWVLHVRCLKILMFMCPACPVRF